VQAAASVADGLGEPGLHVHVDVLELDVPRQLAGGELAGDDVEAGGDRLGVGRRDDALAGEHARVRLRAGDVVRQEPLVEVDRRVERRRLGIELAGEAAAAGALGLAHAVAPYVGRVPSLGMRAVYAPRRRGETA
jgi:hypothetical protein